MWNVLLGLCRCGGAPALRKRSFRQIQKEFNRRCFFEALEDRKVLATLPLGGTEGDDVIDINEVSGNLLVSLNNVTIYNGSVAGFDTVEINAGSGNDVVNLNSLPSATAGSPIVAEVEGNDTLLTAQNLDGPGWHVDPPASPHSNIIGDESGDRSFDEHITVQASGDGTVDVYAFTVEVGADPVNVLLDIDFSTGGLDSYLELLDASGSVVAFSDDGPPLDAGSSSALDSFISYTFGAPGTYHWFVRVDSVDNSAQPIGSVPVGTSYDLHVVIPGHEIPGGGMPLVVVNGGDDNDTLNVDASLMLPLSATEDNVLAVGPAAYAGTLFRGTDDRASYSGVETFNGGATFTVLTDLVDLGLQDNTADTTWVRGNLDGTKLLVDVNGSTYFTGGSNQILIAAVNGSADADTILVENTLAKAHIDGGAGNDTITTSAAPDIVYGGEGDDTISGGDGDDTLFGNGGNDVLSGQVGNDLVSGGTGDDQVSGQSGQDVLIGGTGLDQVLGNSDRDLLFASWAKLGAMDISEDFEALQQLRVDWLKVVVDLTMSVETFRAKYFTGDDDGVEDKLQGGNGDDLFFLDGSARIIDSAGDRDPLT